MRKLAYIIVLMLALPAVASAQVAKQVEVSKDYKPTVSAAQNIFSAKRTEMHAPLTAAIPMILAFGVWPRLMARC